MGAKGMDDHAGEELLTTGPGVIKSVFLPESRGKTSPKGRVYNRRGEIKGYKAWLNFCNCT